MPTNPKGAALKLHTSPIVSAAEMWSFLCEEGGLQLAWEGDQPQPGYDRALESDISKVLFGDDTKSLASQLQGSKVSTAVLLNAFFATLQPFAQMLREIYAMLDTANASAQDKILSVALKSEELDQSLLATLDQFREWEEELRAASVRVVIPAWDSKSLWELRGAFADESKSFGQPISDPWDDLYRKKPGFVDPPRYEPVGDSVFDEVAELAYSVVDWFVQSCRSLAPDHNALLKKFAAEGGYGRDVDQDDADFNFLRTIAHVESDFWPVGIVSQIRLAKRRLLDMSGVARQVEAARISNNVSSLIAALPRSEMLIDGFEKVLRDVFQLPVWKQRSAVYSVWVSTQIVAGLAPRRVEFHTENGKLNFGFAGSRLARIETAEGYYTLWSELRTKLLRKNSRYRKQSIQPDYRILSPRNEEEPTSTCLVVECKQYKKASNRNFSEAANDYAVSCPDAVVALVNYGPIGTSLAEKIEPSARGRAIFLEHFKPTGASDLLKEIIEKTVPAPVKAEQPWVEGGTVHLSWMAPLRDLDLYALLTTSQDVHTISFSRRIDVSMDIELSEDERTAPGNEYLHINTWGAESYDIYVHNYSEIPSLCNAEAFVSLRIGDLERKFTAPDTGVGTWWHVCTIEPRTKSITPEGHLLINRPF